VRVCVCAVTLGCIVLCFILLRTKTMQHHVTAVPVQRRSRRRSHAASAADDAACARRWSIVKQHSEIHREYRTTRRTIATADRTMRAYLHGRWDDWSIVDDITDSVHQRAATSSMSVVGSTWPPSLLRLVRDRPCRREVDSRPTRVAARVTGRKLSDMACGRRFPSHFVAPSSKQNKSDANSTTHRLTHTHTHTHTHIYIYIYIYTCVKELLKYSAVDRLYHTTEREVGSTMQMLDSGVGVANAGSWFSRCNYRGNLQLPNTIVAKSRFEDVNIALVRNCCYTAAADTADLSRNKFRSCDWTCDH